MICHLNLYAKNKMMHYFYLQIFNCIISNKLSAYKYLLVLLISF